MTLAETNGGLSLGIDIGSTTSKLVLTNGTDIIYEKYERHFSQVRQKTAEMVAQLSDVLAGSSFNVAISGSAGLGVAQAAKLPFVQEVYATGEVIKKLLPDTSVVIELGGEDAKVIFFDGGIDERMNGSCAGGTGAFIDQMAVLLNMDVNEMDALSLEYKRIYPIASRCGVFAKTDIQPLLNQGAAKSDVAASIYQAVVNQTIAGLAQGKAIKGKVVFLGGPLYYCQGLKDRFKETLKLSDEDAVFPEYGRFAVALGAAIYGYECQSVTYEDLLAHLNSGAASTSEGTGRMKPLFEDKAQYAEFISRHARESVEAIDINSYSGNAWLGIDSGSTTTKLVLISEGKQLLYSFYAPNQGDPTMIIHGELVKLRTLCADRIKICGAATTGYGEDLIKSAFHADEGLVETIAHYTAARHFQPEVDFILDIGGQDIKCFKIRNHVIDSIMLNEACSSGCGSFIETFAKAMGYGVEEFAQRGIDSSAPVNLGSRCTVFMNSAVKQSQKDGATVEDISAGLSISVVKNAIYKVIRAATPEALGKNIVVQGGTFLNDAVLRAFELELGAPVIRPSIAGLMGAFGAALHAMRFKTSTLLQLDELNTFTHTSKSSICRSCPNGCHLTINTFSDGNRFIFGNQCQKAFGIKDAVELPNLHQWKRDYLASLAGVDGGRGKIGLPLALGMYELAPLWHGIFTALGFRTVISKPSTRETYNRGQFSIPSDTACYPAKIMHGHIEELIDEKIDTIFYPSLTYNIDEKASDNHYNCPVVAYYAELLAGNMESLKNVKFLYPYLNINSQPALVKTLLPTMQQIDPGITKRELAAAVKTGFAAYEDYMAQIKAQGEKALAFARENNLRIMILAGRPYHIDPEIGHGIDKLATSLGFVVVSEDAVFHLEPEQHVKVLNQWTYHARLYRAGRYAANHKDTELVQLVSFGCGVDAITTDELRDIMESEGKFYTQIKIDEITNLGAVRIRLRSLIGALDERK